MYFYRRGCATGILVLIIAQKIQKKVLQSGVLSPFIGSLRV